MNASSNHILCLDDYLFKAIKCCLYMYIFDNWIKKIIVIILELLINFLIVSTRNIEKLFDE